MPNLPRITGREALEVLVRAFGCYVARPGELPRALEAGEPTGYLRRSGPPGAGVGAAPQRLCDKASAGPVRAGDDRPGRNARPRKPRVTDDMCLTRYATGHGAQRRGGG